MAGLHSLLASLQPCAQVGHFVRSSSPPCDDDKPYSTMATDAITAIKASLPPKTDYLTYLTILESHLTPEILPTLVEILQDATLTQNIGWDLIQLLIPLPGSETCLETIARLGNPREVVLKVTEALRLLSIEDEEDDIYTGDIDKLSANHGEGSSKHVSEPREVDKFCTLVSLLATLHPRIRTKYPSRFLSTSLIAMLASYRPSDQATLAVIAFLHSVSGKKRPPLPQRKSSLSISLQLDSKADASAPDPEATAEEPQEGAILEKLLQSFVTHILEVYINATGLEWTARLQEHFDPDRIVPGRKSFGEAFREDPVLIDRDMIVGQLVVSTLNPQLPLITEFARLLLATSVYPAARSSSMQYMLIRKKMKWKKSTHLRQMMYLFQELDPFSSPPVLSSPRSCSTPT
jgi:hypothetical protein